MARKSSILKHKLHPPSLLGEVVGCRGVARAGGGIREQYSDNGFPNLTISSQRHYTRRSRRRCHHSPASSNARMANIPAWFHTLRGGHGWFSGMRTGSGKSSNTFSASASV